MQSYRVLDASRIVDTARRLEHRVRERFPETGLRRVASELATVAVEAQDRCRDIRRNYRGLRAAIVLLTTLVVFGFVAALTQLHADEDVLGFKAFFEAMDSALGTFVFLGATGIFLWSVENRLKRRRALTAITELRAMAHIVDMHQLTKDPEPILDTGRDTEHSPERNMTPFELSRYLDYCSEMLSLVAKIAALYVQAFPDEVALTAVDEVGNLCTGLSRKIWQKIMILDRFASERRSRA